MGTLNRRYSESEKGIQESARRIVTESPQFASIRETIREKELDPIWAQLIAEFGSIMYAKGVLSRTRSDPRRRTRDPAESGYEPAERR